nr:hypothetical protein [Tanacetum cinerariifolium]
MAPKRARTTRANPDPTRTTTTTEPMTQEAINNLIAQRVAEAIAKYETQRNSVINGDTSNTTGTGPRTVHPTRECTYKDYLNYGPLKFNGTERVIVSQEVAYAMPWRTLKQMMTAKVNSVIRDNVSRGVSRDRKNLKVKGTDITRYTLHFQELTLLCGKMFPEESVEIERYVGGLPEMIRGNVMSYKPKTMQKAIQSANDQMDQKLLGIADRQADNKRKFDNTSRNKQNQQPFRRNNNVAQAYAAGNNNVAQAYDAASGEKPYRGTQPLCPKCNLYHDGPCRPKCTNCKRAGHIARDCRNQATNPKYNNNNNNRRATVAYQGGNQNLAGNENVVARAYAVGITGGNPNANVVPGTFLLNNHYASILFDTGADKSFVSTAFSSLIDINPSTLDYSYDVELADGQIIGLKMYHIVIVCDEKIVCIPFEDETLIIRFDGSNNKNQLNIISCTKTRKYLLKGYPVFLANITTKMIKDKSKEKQLEDVPIVRDFSEVFPEDLPGLPPTRQVDF